MSAQITFATAEDAPAIAKIYAPFVEKTAVSFEIIPPSAAEMATRIEALANAHLPWLVMKEDRRLLGYAYAAKHRDREAYQWSVESSAYVDESARRLSVGRSLYKALFDILERQGFQNVYAGTTLPNDASIAFHKSFGFSEIGVYRKVGYKLGKWHDVAWWYVRIGAHNANPTPPLGLSGITIPT
jgi:L-amino acid N-acyltransferase YncA